MFSETQLSNKDEVLNLLLQLAVENERLSAALRCLKSMVKEDKAFTGVSSVILSERQINTVLEIANMKDVEIDIIPTHGGEANADR